MTIGIPGIPCGNFASVVRMVEKCGGAASIVSDPRDLLRFDKVILAGVGAFDYGMSSLRSAGWEETLGELALVRRIPILGICLGMQLICTKSEEGVLPGLGWIDADVRRFDASAAKNLKVPHMGWSPITVSRPNPLIAQSEEEQRFYFVHSYYVSCVKKENELALAEYGNSFVAAVNEQNIYGVQFHPEKSHRFGMAIMRNFLAL